MKGPKFVESVAFEENTGSDDGFGGKMQAWTQRHVCRADFYYQRGDESVSAARLAGRQIYKIKIRACAAALSITTDYRMRDTRRGTIYNILDVDKITDRQMIWLQVEGLTP